MCIIYLDFDNTIVESNKRVIEIINQRYKTNKTESDLHDYGYQSIYPISNEEKLDIYASDEFFQGLELKPKVLSTILKYMQKYKIVVTTKGTFQNLEKKRKWIIDNLPSGVGFIGINNDSLSKSSVDMKDGIQIDDVIDALDTNAKVKVLYKDGNNFPWHNTSHNSNVLVANSWLEIDELLDFCSKYDYHTLQKIV